jgi:hypothetical protein
MGNQMGNRRTTGRVPAQNLAQEDPQRDQWRIDPVLPTPFDCLQCWHNAFRCEDIAEGEPAFLEKLTPQESELMAKPTFAKTTHR